ncbi:MAG: AtzE family amidohydrolase, partial [Alphaproteobacteria bacterium]|nr:AtzE family amidohydrolase [Alphaproteobacteria bacterium]
EAGNGRLNAFTAVTASRALADAQRVDATVRDGRDPGPLAGVPFAVKNLFDVAGLTTLAGSKINRDHPPASRDATAVARLCAAGAVLVGALNMDEYAYGFTTENSHYGACHNPHDLSRVAGGSSGGSAAAVAAGLVPLSLGTDTNGSIRVPASLCGTFGLKPSYGRLSRAGAALFVSSLDHIGPFARSTADIATVFDALQGPDSADPVCTAMPAEPTLPALDQGIKGLRIAVAGDYFARGTDPEVFDAVAAAAKALEATRTVIIPEAARARAAAVIITATEGANLHLSDLRSRPGDFDPLTRDRFLAGALIPNQWYLQAQRFRAWYREQVRLLFREVDIILAPATPCTAPPIAAETMTIAGVEMAKGPNLGLFTQPISFIGLPVLTVPIHRPGRLPLGIQVIAAPFRDAATLRVGAALEAAGIATAPIA